jgi:hypothetical protein
MVGRETRASRVELADRCARDLERVAPARSRMRAEFVRRAIRRAIDLALDRATGEAYLLHPLAGDWAASDLAGWDGDNRLASLSKTARPRKTRSTSAA